MSKNYLIPPLMKNGNPLSAYGVNQIIGSINTIKSDYFDYNVLKQRTAMYNSFPAWESRYVLLHTFKNLRIVLYVAGLNNMGNIKVYAKAIGKNKTSYLINTTAITTSPQTLTINLNMDSGLGGFNVSYGDIYLISLRNDYEDSGIVHCWYMYEYQDTAPVAPTIPTISASTVVDETYLNNIVNAIRNIPSRANVNVPFNGVGSPGDYNASGYMSWLGRRRSRYLFYGFLLIDGEVEIKFSINGQLISTTESNAVGNNFYNLSYDFQTNPSGINVPSIGSDYSFSALFTHVDEGHPSAAAFVNYAYESDN